MSASTTALPVEHPADVELHIRPKKGWIGIDFAELWVCKELLGFLIWKDVKVRYKQTVLGMVWAILQPLLSMAIFTVIFGNFVGIGAKLPEGLSYPLFVYAGLLPWQFYSTAVNTGGMSLVNQQHLLTKVYFPRLFLPASALGVAGVDWLISFAVFLVLIPLLGGQFLWTLVFVPFLLLLTGVVALGMSYLLSALTVHYRDFRFLIPFMLQTWMYLTPVIYPSKLLGEYSWILAINPLTGLIDAYRGCILGMEFSVINLLISLVVAAGLLVFGALYFKRTERRFADIA